MTNLLGILIGLAGLAASAAVLARPRRVLRFRSPGRIERGSIPAWRVRVWQGIGCVVAVVAGTLLYVSA